MAKDLPLKLVKNAWLWGGTGYLLQTYGESGLKANLWRSVGVISLIYGIHVFLQDLEAND